MLSKCIVENESLSVDVLRHAVYLELRLMHHHLRVGSGEAVNLVVCGLLMEERSFFDAHRNLESVTGYVL